jgi:GMP synthase (glutamine-hydrolysing)
MTTANHPDTVLIVDFGSQFTQLIARRIREAGVFSEIVPFQSAEAAFKRINPKAVILSGGPASTSDIGSPRAPQIVFDAGVPVLGICYGQMALCVQMGGVAESSNHREFGRAFVEIEKDSPLFEGLWAPGQRHQVWMSHGDRVISLPKGFEVFGKSEGSPFAIFGNVARKMYGIMFHPEVVHTPDGARLLRNFVHNIAGIEGDWTMRAYR